MSTKNMGRSLTESGHTRYAKCEFKRLRRVERRRVRECYKKYVGPETESMLNNLRLKHGIWGWRAVHKHKTGLIERYFISRIGTNIDQAKSDLYFKHSDLGHKDRWVRKNAKSIIWSLNKYDNDCVSLGENDMICKSKPWTWESRTFEAHRHKA